jgi:colanic acid/amylovoran biosynthesis glycosyltransferase
MRLLLVTSMSPEKSSTFIMAQVRHLQPLKVLHSGFRPFRFDDSTIFKFPLNLSLLRILIKRVIPVAYSWIYTRALEKFLRENNFEVVLCFFGPQGSNIASACSKAKIPLLVYFLGYDAYVTTLLKKYRNRYTNLFKLGYHFIVVSEDMKDQLIKLGCREEKIKEIPCGFDTKIFKQVEPGNNGQQLIFVGRFTEKKAPDLLVLSFNYALKIVPEARLVMIGQGELLKKVQRLIVNLGIEKSVELLGSRSPEVVIEEMNKSRAYVQHSRIASNGDSEGSPVSIIEAAGSGLPIISTRHAGIKETVIHDKSGFLVDEGDWESMGKYMILLLRNPELASVMGIRGRQHILQNFDIDQQMHKLRELFSEAKNVN